MKVIETDRLTIRRISIADAAFILKLLNDPNWLKFIGDKGVRTIDQARDYIVQEPMRMYEKHGFGLYLVEMNRDFNPIGMCGLIKRDYLQDVDIGFAFLPEYMGKGFAFEAASAVIESGRKEFEIKRFVAIASQDNENSIKLLKRLGLQYEKLLELPDQEQVELYSIDFNDCVSRQ